MNLVIYELDEIRRRMANCGLGAMLLSAKADIDPKTTKKILTTQTGHPEQVYKLAKALGIDVKMRRIKVKGRKQPVKIFDLSALHPHQFDRVKQSAKARKSA